MAVSLIAAGNEWPGRRSRADRAPANFSFADESCLQARSANKQRSKFTDVSEAGSTTTSRSSSIASEVHEDDAEDWAIGCDRDAIDDRVDRVTQILKAGDESDVEFARSQPPAKRRRMIEMHRAAPTVDERPGVEVFDTPEAQRSRDGHLRRRPVRLPPPIQPWRRDDLAGER